MRSTISWSTTLLTTFSVPYHSDSICVTGVCVTGVCVTGVCAPDPQNINIQAELCPWKPRISETEYHGTPA